MEHGVAPSVHKFVLPLTSGCLRSPWPSASSFGLRVADAEQDGCKHDRSAVVFEGVDLLTWRIPFLLCVVIIVTRCQEFFVIFERYSRLFTDADQISVS